MPPGAAPGYGGGMNQPQHQEFDHAISYVTNIKQRFQNEPDTYKAFLDILHAYQRDQSKPKEQQKGIHEVLDQVSTLFADHPDLLKEFTYFLPDAVQGQAKERLDRAARESEMRKAGMRNRQHGHGGQRGKVPEEPARVKRGVPRGQDRASAAAFEKLADTDFRTRVSSHKRRSQR